MQYRNRVAYLQHSEKDRKKPRSDAVMIEQYEQKPSYILTDDTPGAGATQAERGKNSPTASCAFRRREHLREHLAPAPACCNYDGLPNCGTYNASSILYAPLTSHNCQFSVSCTTHAARVTALVGCCMICLLLRIRLFQPQPPESGSSTGHVMGRSYPKGQGAVRERDERGSKKQRRGKERAKKRQKEGTKKACASYASSSPPHRPLLARGRGAQGLPQGQARPECCPRLCSYLVLSK